MNSRKRDKPLASSLTLPTPEWLDPAQPGDSSAIAVQQVHLPKSQPRRYFDPQSLSQLTNSIRQQGILQPIIVRPRPAGGYELVAGERRLRAATAAGLTHIPAVVRDLEDGAARQIALLENLQRENLNEFEETEAIVDLLSLQLNRPAESIPTLLRQIFNATTRRASDGSEPVDNNAIISAESVDSSDLAELVQTTEQVFQHLGSMNWKSFVSNRLPLLKLPEEIQQALRQGEIAYTKAKAIAKIKDAIERSQLLEVAIAQNLSLREINSRIAATKTKEKLPIQQRLDTTYQKIRKARIWENAEKQQRLETLLQELDSLLNE